jgi:hypothetical protein
MCEGRTANWTEFGNARRTKTEAWDRRIAARMAIEGPLLADSVAKVAQNLCEIRIRKNRIETSRFL